MQAPAVFRRRFFVTFAAMRYFLELAYHGAAYHGWQRQPHSPSVQQALEECLSVLLRQPIEVTGCGRTDTGVHASQYYLHFDFDGDFPIHFLRRLNRLLPPDIAVFRLLEVTPEAHARFDATRRSYRYHLTFRKDPFLQQVAYYYPYPQRPDFDHLLAAGRLLLDYDAFFPFCRSNSDAKTMRCDLQRVEWERVTNDNWTFHISADRFLRGMVRLIVGMCINVGTGQLPLEDVRLALDRQTRLEKAQSAPPQGLFLTEVIYPYVNRRTEEHLPAGRQG